MGQSHSYNISDIPAKLYLIFNKQIYYTQQNIISLFIFNIQQSTLTVTHFLHTPFKIKPKIYKLFIKAFLLCRQNRDNFNRWLKAFCCDGLLRTDRNKALARKLFIWGFFAHTFCKKIKISSTMYMNCYWTVVWYFCGIVSFLSINIFLYNFGYIVWLPIEFIWYFKSIINVHWWKSLKWFRCIPVYVYIYTFVDYTAHCLLKNPRKSNWWLVTCNVTQVS